MNNGRLRYNEDDFNLIERCFSAIKTKTDIADNLRKIERALGRIFNIDFNLSISENTSTTFYGMSVYPTIDTMDLLVKTIVEDKKDSEAINAIWANNDTWHIEIDSILLYDMSLNANPTEITAVMLHEIGHVVYSNTIPRRLYKIFRYKMMRLTYGLRKLFTDEKIRKLLNIAITESCSTKSYSMSKYAETDADRFVIHYGYGKALDSFIDKLLSRYGNEHINKSQDEIERDISVIVNWTVTNIKELEFRKTGLKTALKVEMLKNPSIFTKKIIQDIYNTFFGEVTDKYRVLLSEQYMTNPSDKYAELQAEQNFTKYITKVTTEAMNPKSLFDKNGKLKKINQSDIDILYVESDNIKTVDDKIYLLDKTYSQLEIVNAGLDYIESADKEMNMRVTQSKSTLIRMKEQLEKIRLNILSTKIIEKEWGTFVRMPKGYEG